MRQAARKDNAHFKIQADLETMRHLGIAYHDTSQLKAAWDFIVFFRGNVFLFEAKTRERASKAEQDNRRLLLTPGESEAHDNAARGGVMIHVVFDTDEVLEIIGAT